MPNDDQENRSVPIQSHAVKFYTSLALICLPIVAVVAIVAVVRELGRWLF